MPTGVVEQGYLVPFVPKGVRRSVGHDQGKPLAPALFVRQAHDVLSPGGAPDAEGRILPSCDRRQDLDSGLELDR